MWCWSEWGEWSCVENPLIPERKESGVFEFIHEGEDLVRFEVEDSFELAYDDEYVWYKVIKFCYQEDLLVVEVLISTGRICTLKFVFELDDVDDVDDEYYDDDDMTDAEFMKVHGYSDREFYDMFVNDGWN